MHKDTKKLTKTSQVILCLLAVKGTYDSYRLSRTIKYALFPEMADAVVDRRMNKLIYDMKRRGWIREELVETKKICKLTEKGELEALLRKAQLHGPSGRWDGKWRIVVFDIPEGARRIRDRLRKLLKQFGFFALQASVYAYPYPLNTEAILVLNKSGLRRYIRIAKVEAFDDDRDLRRHFKLVTTFSRP